MQDKAVRMTNYDGAVVTKINGLWSVSWIWHYSKQSKTASSDLHLSPLVVWTGHSTGTVAFSTTLSILAEHQTIAIVQQWSRCRKWDTSQSCWHFLVQQGRVDNAEAKRKHQEAAIDCRHSQAGDVVATAVATDVGAGVGDGVGEGVGEGVGAEVATGELEVAAPGRHCQ